jgi:hypothetical protein
MGDNVVIPPGYQAAVDRYLNMRLHVASDMGPDAEAVAGRLGVARTEVV